MSNCCPTKIPCTPWDISKQERTNCYADSLVQETLNVAGAPINIHKLLGVHDQLTLSNVTGYGTPISGGDQPSGPASSAFSKLANAWRSIQIGTSVEASAFIGYDFGVKRMPNGRVRYGVNANAVVAVGTIEIKQSSDSARRASKVRVERSDDGIKWYGVSVVSLPDDDQLHSIAIKRIVPSRFWRLRPVEFGGTECDVWEVTALAFLPSQQTLLDGIQDIVLLENRDRDYATTPLEMKCYYDFISNMSDLTRFGIEMPQASYQIKLNFTACVNVLGRPIVIGDIVELPSEAQYTPTLAKVKKYLEVTDVTWDTTSYTPGWIPLTLQITAQPALAAQETQKIFGDFAATVDSSGLFNGNDGNNSKYQDKTAISHAIKNEALNQVPERGSEGSNVVRQFTAAEIEAVGPAAAKGLAKMSFRPSTLYVEDAIPQNGAPFSEGPTFPTSPANGEYHRMTYVGTAKDVPARLYRWSSAKNQWIYLETDRRALYNNQQPVLQEFVTSSVAKFAKDIK